jgi:MFS family permease
MGIDDYPDEVANPALNRSILAVLFGTFTLRFSTGLTGVLLQTYLSKLHEHGGPRVTGLEVGILTAVFFLSELTLSPPFGILSDRLGTHRVMQWGPIFGVVAVLMTAVTTHSLVLALIGIPGVLIWLGATRLLEGAAAGASIPSILGYIAAATSHDAGLRGRTVARFEGATFAGIGLGIVAAGLLYQLLGPAAFLVNAVVYACSFLIYRYGVADLRHDLEVANEPPRHFDLGAYLTLLRSSAVWLLAPTWIALNAVLGSWASQSVFQLVNEPKAKFEHQLLNGGLEPWQISVGAAVALVVFFSGLVFWGNRLKRYRRTTVIGVGAGGGLLMLASAAALNHSHTFPWPVVGILLIGVVFGIFILAGATPAALGLLADITEAHPEDRGALMGLYSVFLGTGQIIGGLAGGAGADMAGIDGLLAVSTVLLLIALVPLGRLRASEHIVDAHGEAGRQRMGKRNGSDG